MRAMYSASLLVLIPMNLAILPMTSPDSERRTAPIPAGPVGWADLRRAAPSVCKVALMELVTVRGAYSTLPNGQSDASHSLTARQSGVSSCAWLARTQESARASYSLSGSG